MPAAAVGAADAVPLVVDLDGTLLHGDLLHESALRLVGGDPLSLLRLPLWLLQGKAHFKRQIAGQVELDVEAMPRHEALIAWLAEQRRAGRKVVLCTASDAGLAHAVATAVGGVDDVMASDGTVNLAGARKAEALVERFGERGFDYVGNARTDLAVWRRARRGIVVSRSARLGAAARRVVEVERTFEAPDGGPLDWLRAIRVHQWAKNVLVFLPLLASHRLQELPLVLSALLAFVAFSLTASSVYLLNDLFDLESDRRHPRKRTRGFASGRLSAAHGAAASAALGLAGFAVASAIGAGFIGWLALYLAVTLAYTLLLKRKILVDALSLAALYTLRILAGGEAIGIWPGFWLLALSMFLFLSLAFVKRYSELLEVREQGRRATPGRDYQTGDLPLVETFGVASGFAAVVVLSLYMNGDSITRLYATPTLVWITVPLLLYWVTRIWVKAHRGELHDDPVVFALTDGLSLTTIALFVAALVAASHAW